MVFNTTILSNNQIQQGYCKQRCIFDVKTIHVENCNDGTIMQFEPFTHEVLGENHVKNTNFRDIFQTIQ